MRRVFKTAELRNHIRLPYAEQGEPTGLPVLFLHGFTDSWRSFEPVLDHLPARIHAFAPTQRGHGDASRPADGYSVRDFARDLLFLLDELRLPSCVLVGHSMGSAVAQRFAIDHPDRALALVLISASPTIEASNATREFWKSALSQLGDAQRPALVRGMTEAMLAQPVSRGFVDAMIEEGVKVPAFVWTAALQSRWRSEGDFSGELNRIKAPTLIVWGARDDRYPRAVQDELQERIQGSRLIVYEGAGHLLHWEEPERVALDLSRFLRGLE